MTFMLSNKSLAKLEGVHPRLVAVIKRAIQLSTQDFAVVQGVRTQAEQNTLYEQGRTKPGNIVTWTRNSKHIPVNGFGMAVDLCPYPIDWDTPSKFVNIASAVAKAAQELGVKIKWGGHFEKTKDMPHFQLEE